MASECVGMGMSRSTFRPVAGDLVCQLAIDVDALAQALGEDLTGGQVHQLVLQRRAACIDHENFSWLCQLL